MSLIARSYRTLSGCLVSLVMGLSYFLRLKPQLEVNRPPIRIAMKRCRAIVMIPRCSTLQFSVCCSNLHPRQGGLASRSFQFQEGRTGVRSVKYGRPCNQPVTPGAGDLGGVLERHSPVDFNGEIQS